jgi:predicted lipid-binding transport protein (Tim44 family)
VTGLDLIIFAAIAVFLGWKLYTVLGRRTGNERQIDPFATPPSRPNGSVGAPGAKPADATAGTTPRLEAPHDDAARAQPDDRPVARREQRQLEAMISQAPEAVRKGLESIRGADPEFDPTGFLAGAKIAFDMILQAFAAGDANALKPLLAPELLQHFTGAIADRQREKLTLKSTLVGIIGLELLDAELKVNVTQDAEGRIVDGHPNEVVTINDIWTFSRPVASRDPNWVLIATESPS